MLWLISKHKQLQCIYSSNSCGFCFDSFPLSLTDEDYLSKKSFPFVNSILWSPLNRNTNLSRIQTVFLLYTSQSHHKLQEGSPKAERKAEKAWNCPTVIVTRRIHTQPTRTYSYHSSRCQSSRRVQYHCQSFKKRATKPIRELTRCRTARNVICVRRGDVCLPLHFRKDTDL